MNTYNWQQKDWPESNPEKIKDKLAEGIGDLMVDIQTVL
jgi:hypothetical protein